MTLRAIIFIAGLALLFTIVGSIFGVEGAALALAISIAISFWSYWSAAPELLIRIGAKPCTNPRVLTLIRSVAGRAGIPAPEVFLVKDRHPNALVIGPSPKRSVLILTSRLCSELSQDELQAVIAHELSHIKNRDLLVRTLASSFVGAIASLALLLGLIGLASRRNGGVAAIVIAIAAPAIALLLQLALSRSAEYRADYDAARLCGDPNKVISALRHLGYITQEADCRAALSQPAIAPLFFLDPFPQSWLSTIFSPHPSIPRRIARLKALLNRNS